MSRKKSVAEAKSKRVISKPSLDEVVKRKREIKQRLDVTGSQFHRALRRAVKTKQESLLWKTKLDSFLYLHADSNGKVSERYKSELNQMIDKVEATKKAAEIAEEEHITLRDERTALSEEFSSLFFYATLDDVLEYQDRVAQAEEKVSDFQAKIARQGEIIEKASSLGGELIALNQERQDLLAAIETGEATREDLKELDEKITVASEDSGSKDKITKEAQQTILGLNRRLEDAQRELKYIQSQREEILRQFFTSEAVDTYEEYIQLGRELDQVYLQLIGLNELFTKYAPLPHPHGIVAVPIHKMKIPAFNLETRTIKQRVPADGLLSTEILNNAEICEAEKERMRQMGVIVV